MSSRSRNIFIIVIVAVVVIAGIALHLGKSGIVNTAGLVLNTARSSANPEGTFTLETNPQAPAPGPQAAAPAEIDDGVDKNEWPSYNRTLASVRYSPLNQIDARTAANLKVRCTYDTGLHESFESGPLVVQGALIFTSANDIYSIDPDTCKENWHTHEAPNPHAMLMVNRGAAYLDGRLFRGTLDGRFIAYDFKTGKKLWATTIADASKNEMVDAAPIAWNGLVFAGIAMGDFKGLKGTVYALDATDGHIVWQIYTVPSTAEDKPRGPLGQIPSVTDTWSNHNSTDIPISGGGTWTSYSLDTATGRLYIPVGNPSPDYVPGVRTGTNLYTNSMLIVDAKTGNYIHHYQIAPSDWHDWDVSNAPALITTRGGKQLMAFTPKDGNLYGYDLAAKQLIYRSEVTRHENGDAPLTTDKETHFCPGSVGGGEWNGAAYHPGTNLLYSGDDDWCTAVKIVHADKVKETKDGDGWMGADTVNPLDSMGTQDPHSQWAGWLYATDADSGQWRWRIKTNYPILSGVTPTAGGVVFFGDMGGNFYAVDAASGQKLFHQKLAGAIGGGVITYAVNGEQRVAVAPGLASIFWPVETTTAKIVVLGLDGAAAH